MIELETQRKQKKDDISREGGRERDVTLKIKPESGLRKKTRTKLRARSSFCFFLPEVQIRGD